MGETLAQARLRGSGTFWPHMSGTLRAAIDTFIKSTPKHQKCPFFFEKLCENLFHTRLNVRNTGEKTFTQNCCIYGTSKRLISDGSKSLQAGKNAIFPNVVHQLCTFHKLRNLYKVILRNVRDKSQVRRCLRLAQHIFSNRYVSSRKHAAQTLKQLGGEQVATYIDAHILGKWWRKLTRSLTNNASERFNRKVKKCVSVRYGLPTEESARVLIRALWLKELLLNGQKHIAATHPLNTIDLSRICQNHLPRDHILHFLRTCLSLDPDVAA